MSLVRDRFCSDAAHYLVGHSPDHVEVRVCWSEGAADLELHLPACCAGADEFFELALEVIPEEVGDLCLEASCEAVLHPEWSLPEHLARRCCAADDCSAVAGHLRVVE